MTEIIAMLVCIALNSFLSLTEMAFVSVGKNRLRELARQGNKDAQRLVLLRDNPERTLSILQIGISLLGAIAAATGGVSIEEALSPYLQNQLGLSESVSEVLGIILVVFPLTYLSVVLGELVPKTLALRDPLKVSLKSAKWLVLADKIFMPVVNLLEWSTKKILSAITPRVKTPSQEQSDDAVDIDRLSAPHRQYVLNLINIKNKRIRDVYVPVKDVTSVSVDKSIDEVHLIFIESGYTRLPVIESGTIVGTLHSKEFMAFQASGKKDWKEILRPALSIHTQDSLLKVLRLVQTGKNQMALVTNGHETVGIVTLEDIVEEIIGDVFDEDEDNAIQRVLSTGSTLRAPRPE